MFLYFIYLHVAILHFLDASPSHPQLWRQPARTKARWESISIGIPPSCSISEASSLTKHWHVQVVSETKQRLYKCMSIWKYCTESCCKPLQQRLTYTIYTTIYMVWICLSKMHKSNQNKQKGPHQLKVSFVSFHFNRTWPCQTPLASQIALQRLHFHPGQPATHCEKDWQGT